jgi:hypothetical protein
MVNGSQNFIKQKGILLLEIFLFPFYLCTISVSGQEVMFHYNAEHTEILVL